MSPSCQSREIPGPALCAASGASGGPTLMKYHQPFPCPGCSEIRSLWLESPLPRPERARGGRGVSRERDEGVGVACRRWARKQAGASWPALKI